MRMKKLTAWTLSAAMVSSMLLAPVFAAGSNAEKTMETVTETVTAQVSPELDLPSNDELFALYADQVLYGYEMTTFGTIARDKLNTIERNIYDALKKQIESVATSGGSTVIELSDLSALGLRQTQWDVADLDVANTDKQAIMAAVSKKLEAQFNWNDITDALLSDCPFELYWYDKTETGGVELQTAFSYTLDKSTGIYHTASVPSLTFTFYVAKDYQGNGNTDVIKDVSRVPAAKTEANRLVTEVNQNYSTNYEKLVAYKKYICEAVSYNTTAAETDDYPYGDPWQLIYVFDGDSTTNVVCEGYSKALQYLCDLDDQYADEYDFNCISSTGTMNSGAHMWNVVNLDNLYYLVDVTNCDTGMVGQNDKLFLRPITLGTSTYNDLSSVVTYVYDAESQALMEGLTLATSAYVVTYPVTIAEGIVGGSVTADKGAAAEGSTVTLTVEPAKGYELGELTVKQGENSVEVVDNKFTMPAGGVTVTAAFVAHTHEWTYSNTDNDETIEAECGVEGCATEGTLTLVAPENLTYDGNAKEVTVVQSPDNMIATLPSVEYASGNINAGEHTAKLEITVGGGKTAQTVSATLPFTIEKAPLTITADAQTKVYGDDDPDLTYNVTKGELFGEDKLTGALTCTNNGDVGTYAIEQGTLEVSDNYEITYVGAELTINQKPITITGATIASVPYDESGEYELNVTEVTFNGIEEGETVGYTATAELTGDNKADAEVAATVTVTLDQGSNYTLGENNTVESIVKTYTHTHSWTYTVANNVITATCGNSDNKCPNENVTLTLVAPEGDALIYDGEAKTVTVEQTDGEGNTVGAFADGQLNVTYTGTAINVGSYTATLSIPVADGDPVEATVDFTITEKKISAETVDVVFKSMTYTGDDQNVEATITTKVGGLNVTGTWDKETVINVDDTVTFTANGNFTGTLTNVKTGMKKATPVVTAPTANTLTFNTMGQYLITAGSTTGGELLYSLEENDNYSSIAPGGFSAGTYTVWYKVVGDNNYNDVAAQSISVTIAPQPLTNLIFEGLAEYYLHTGSAIEPHFTLKYTWGTTAYQLSENEYTVTYSNNVDAGTNATITITDKEGGNYAVSGSTTFEIKKHTHKWEYTANEDTNTITAKCEGTVGECPLKNTAQKFTLVAPTALTYDGKVKEATVSGSIDGVKIPTITYAGDNFTADKAINAGNYTATIAMGEGDNKAVVSVEFTIVPKAITGAEIGTFGALTYDGSAQTPVATVTIDGLEATGSWSQVINVADKTTFTADGNFTGTIENMETGMAKAEQKDAPSDLDVKNETLKGQKDGSISSKTIAMNSMEYATTKDGEYKTIENNLLENLAAGTYHVRYKETENYKPSAAAEVTIAEGKPITVIFNANGKTFASEFSAQLENQSYGTKFTKPTDPKETRGDFVFDGWYKDAGCTTAWNFETDTLTEENVNLYAKWKQVRFTVQVDVKRDNTAYTGEVTVTLMRGSETTATVTGTAPFTFERVDTGVYNLVATYADGTKTELVTVDENVTITLTLPAPGVKSELSVDSGSDTPAVMVGGLDAEAEKVKEDNSGATEVLVTMDVEGKKESDVDKTVVEKIEEAITGNVSSTLSAVVEYLDINVMKKVGDTAPEAMTTTTNVIEIVIPFNFSGRNYESIKVIRHHGDAAAALTKLGSKPDSAADGQYWLDVTNGYIHIYTKQFSTYAVSYTAEYNITFDVNGGTGENSTVPTAPNGTVTLPADPTRDGYTFKGWYTADGTQVTASTVFSGNTTAYAQWTQNYYGGNYDGGDYSAPTYAVSVPTRVENGTVSITSKIAAKGSTITLTVTPDKGYELATLMVTDKNGKEITLTDKGNGKFSFTMPASKVSIKATFVEITAEPEAPVNPFYDVAEGDYFFDAVLWANENGITSGVGNGQFAPHATCTRAQMVTFLWNAAGCPNVSADYGIFNDVTANDYYYKAVLWANANKITSGTGNGAFSADQICTRAQMATFLYKFAEGKAEGTSNPFADVTASDYYAQPIQWAVENGITNGTGANTFGPADPCTRAQMVTFLYRLLAE